MNQPAEPLDAPAGRLAEAIVTLDGSGWVGLDVAGKPVRNVDPDDAEIIEAVIRWRPPEESVRRRPNPIPCPNQPMQSRMQRSRSLPLPMRA